MFIFWNRQSLRKKLSFCFVCMTIFPLLITVAIVGYQGEKIMTRMIFDHNRILTEQTAEDIDQLFNEKIKMLHIAANTDELKAMRPERQRDVLEFIADADTDIHIAVVADNAGNQISRSDGRVADLRITYRDRSYYQAIMQSGERVVSNPLIARSSGHPSIVIAEPIKDANQRVVGVLIADIELHAVTKKINNIKLGKAGYASLVDADGQLLLHSDEAKLDQQEDLSQLPPVKAVLNRQTGVVAYDYEGQKELAAFSYIPQTGWGLIVQQPLENALRDVNTIKEMMLMIALLAAAFAGLIGIIVAKMTTKPLADIAKKIESLAKGNMDVKSRVTTQDEIGQLAATFNDMVTELRARSTALQDSEKKHRSLVEHICIGVYREIIDEQPRLTYANPSLVSMLGCDSVEELLSFPLPTYFGSMEEFDAIHADVEQMHMVKNREVRLRRRDGTPLWGSIMAVKHFDSQRGIFCIDGAVRDITEQKQAKEKLHQAYAQLEQKVLDRTRELTILNEKLNLMSLQDGLTNIANRRYFNGFLERELQRAKREQKSIAFILLDVDYFKLYNDTYGHFAGDECLKSIASALQGSVKRATDLVSRYGGEEFAVILPDTDQNGAVLVGKRILTRIEELNIETDTSPVSKFVTVSLGLVAVVPDMDLTPDMMIIAADRALYRAKQLGRDQLQIADKINSI